MNQVIDFLRGHASARRFTDQSISPEAERMILTTAQQSPTSSNLQGYSIIAIREQATKVRLSELCGNQQHIVDCPLFLVFCADLYRLRRVSERAGYPFFGEYAELFIVATVDTTLVAGRALKRWGWGASWWAPSEIRSPKFQRCLIYRSWSIR